MSLLALLSYKNKQKRVYHPKVLEEAFDDLLKDYNFDTDISGISILDTKKDNKIAEINILNLENNQRLKLEEVNSDVEEDSPFNDSENEK
jgi:hypothetical protein